MDTPQHDFRAAPAADTPSPTQLQIPSSGSVSNTQLATLLTEAYRESENLRKELASARKRAERAERIAQIVNSDPTGSPGASATTATTGSTNGGSAVSAPLDLQQLQQKHTETVKKLIDDYDEQIRSALAARDESEARRRVAQDAWEQLDRYLVELEFRAKDARSAYSSRLSSANVALGPLSLPLVPSPTTILSASVSSPSSANPTQYPGSAMGPPGAVPTYRSSRHSSSRAGSAIFPVLPPHPNPSPASSTTHTPSTRRPRTPSMDAYGANQPPTKRSRANVDDQRGRESRTSYSEHVGLLLPFISIIDHLIDVYLILLFLSSPSLPLLGEYNKPRGNGPPLTCVLLIALLSFTIRSILACSMIIRIRFGNADSHHYKDIQRRVSLIATMDPT